MRLLFFFLLFTSISFAQFSFYESCEEAENAAKSDFKEGSYISRIHGLESNEDFDFEVYYETYLFSKYNIKVSHMGCIVMEHDLCYTNTQDSLIMVKFGKDIFSRTRKTVESKYGSLKREDKAKIIDENKVYDNFFLESFPKFIGNDREIKNFLSDNFSINGKEGYMNEFSIQIGTDGRVEDYITSNEVVINKRKSKRELINELNSLGTWVPAYMFGRKVRSIDCFTINIK